MPLLSEDQIKHYNKKGYVAPIKALTKDQVQEVKKEIEYIEKKWPNELKNLGRNYPHLI